MAYKSNNFDFSNNAPYATSDEANIEEDGSDMKWSFNGKVVTIFVASSGIAADVDGQFVDAISSLPGINPERKAAMEALLVEKQAAMAAYQAKRAGK